MHDISHLQGNTRSRVLPNLNSSDHSERPLQLSPFVRSGDLCMVTGAKGSGKTTFLVDLLACYTLPSHYLDDPEEPIPGARSMLGGAFRLTDDWPSYPPLKIMIVDAENDLSEWRQIMNDTFAGRGLSPTSPEAQYARNRVVYFDAHDFNWNDLDDFRRSFEHEFIPYLYVNAVGVVVIDSLHKLWTQELNAPTWAVEGLGYMRYALQQRQVTTYSIVHTSRDYEGKLDANRFLPGYTSRQENEADTIFGLERIIKDQVLKVHLVKRRAAKWNQEGTYARVALSHTFGSYDRVLHNPWYHERPERDDEPVALDRREGRLLRSLEDLSREFTLHELREAGHNWSRARKTLLRLAETPLLDVRGQGTQEDPLVFQLTAEGLRSARHWVQRNPTRKSED